MVEDINASIKATEFADYFDFKIMRASENNNNEEYDGERYAVVDKAGIFHDRYINNVSDLTSCFDNLLMDYVDTALNDLYNYEYDGKGYEQTKLYLEEVCDLVNTEIYAVVCALANCGESIEDDVE